MYIFCQKIVHSLKITCSEAYIMSKKHPFSQKQIALISFLSKILIKNSLRSCPYLVKKRQFCQIYTLWPKKWIGCPFSDISRKKFALMPIYFQKKTRPFSKKNTAFMPIFCRKNVHSFRNTVLLCQFFQNFHQKPLAVMPIFDQTSILSKLHYIMSQKKSIWCPFFPISHGKIIAVMPNFVKNDHSPKSTLLSSLDCVAILSKTLCSYVIFSKFSWQNP